VPDTDPRDPTTSSGMTTYVSPRGLSQAENREGLPFGTRGGLLVAGAVGYALGVKNTFTMNVEFYTGVDERLPVPMILPPVPDLVDLHDSRMLIADDVADTGQTLALVKGFCAAQVGEVRTAVLYEKPRSIVRSDYVWRRTELWIDFPWSIEPPVVRT